MIRNLFDILIVFGNRGSQRLVWKGVHGKPNLECAAGVSATLTIEYGRIDAARKLISGISCYHLILHQMTSGIMIMTN